MIENIIQSFREAFESGEKVLSLSVRFLEQGARELVRMEVSEPYIFYDGEAEPAFLTFDAGDRVLSIYALSVKDLEDPYLATFLGLAGL